MEKRGRKNCTVNILQSPILKEFTMSKTTHWHGCQDSSRALLLENFLARAFPEQRNANQKLNQWRHKAKCLRLNLVVL